MDTFSKRSLMRIAGFFKLEVNPVDFTSLGDGHIHDTYFAETEKAAHPGYVLQRINSRIFTDVPALMENLRRVTSHICLKAGTDQKDDRALHLIKSSDGLFYHVDEAGNFWRCFRYCRHTPLGEQKMNPQHAFGAGRELGRFQHLLSDFSGPPLHEVIPGFHDLGMRLEAFHRAVEKKSQKRKEAAAKEIDTILALEDEMLLVHRLGKEGKIPQRITHNDTKFNNFLFNADGEAICLIDLDTVMNGYVLYDFGDAVRTIANTSHEDHPSPEDVHFDRRLFTHFTRGYLETASAFLSQTETDLLGFSPGMMTYTMVVRFLTDFLEGDIYYKIKYPEHNLHRTQNQLELLRHIREAKDWIEKTIRQIAGS